MIDGSDDRIGRRRGSESLKRATVGSMEYSGLFKYTSPIVLET